MVERARRRQARDFGRADAIRESLRAGGWAVEDTAGASRLRQIEAPPPPRAVTMLTIVHGWRQDAERWLQSVDANTGAHDFEALLVGNSADAEMGAWLQGLRADRVRVVDAAGDRSEAPGAVGWAEAANRGLAEAAGDSVVLFDPGVELTGDVAGPLLAALADPTVAVAGAFGVRSEDRVGHFHSHAGPEVDAIEGYVLAFRRRQALDAGGFDRRFRFYRIADFEFCFRLRDRTGARALVVPDLPVRRHEHRLWEAQGEVERERLSKRNFYRFLDLWGKRNDLIVG